MSINRLFIAVLLLSQATLHAEIYTIDPAHSAVTFRVAHMVISKVSWRFDKLEGEIVYEKDKPKTWKDFGLTWNKLLESGGLLVGEDVEISIEIEAIAKKA